MAESATAAVVLVHGGFVDGSGWEGVYKILRNSGYDVSIVQNPTLSLFDDVAATRRIVARQQAPVILVGHSYGGVVITEAGNAAQSMYLRGKANLVGTSSARATVHVQTSALDGGRGQGQSFRLRVEPTRGCRAYRDGGQSRETRGELTWAHSLATTTVCGMCRRRAHRAAPNGPRPISTLIRHAGLGRAFRSHRSSAHYRRQHTVAVGG